MKYIDAEKLIVEIDKKWKELADKNVKIGGGKYDIEISTYLSIKNLIDSLQQEQPSLPSNLDEAAEKATGEYVYKEGGPFPGTTGVSFINGFKAGAEWMAEKGVSYTAEIQDLGGLTIGGLPDTVERNLGFFDGDKVIVQIRKAD